MLKKTIAPPYYTKLATPKKYQVLLSQTGTNVPIPFILNNEIGVVTWSRNTVGTYRVTWPNFADTINSIHIQNTQTAVIVAAFDSGLGYIEVTTYHVNTTALADGMLAGAYCEITAQQVLT